MNTTTTTTTTTNETVTWKGLDVGECETIDKYGLSIKSPNGSYKLSFNFHGTQAELSKDENIYKMISEIHTLVENYTRD